MSLSLLPTLEDHEATDVAIIAPTALSLQIPPGQTFDDWVELGRNLCLAEKRLNWLIGDWWAHGSHAYGERAKIAAQGVFGKELGTLMNCASVCRAFETSRRREALSWSHHAEVAALPTGDADEILTQAEQDDLSSREIRIIAMKRKVALGIFRPREDDDPEYTELIDIARRWNRARPSVRQQFLDLATEANLGVIDP